MRMMIEHFITFFLLLVFVWIGVMYVMQNLSYSSARQYHSGVVNQIEDSNFSEDIIAECKDKAEKVGYDLNIERYYNGTNQDAMVTLSFIYEIPILHTQKTYSIQGYAR